MSPTGACISECESKQGQFQGVWGGGYPWNERVVAAQDATELWKAAIIPHPRRRTCRLNGPSPRCSGVGARRFFRLTQHRCCLLSSSNPTCVGGSENCHAWQEEIIVTVGGHMSVDVKNTALAGIEWRGLLSCCSLAHSARCLDFDGISFEYS